MRLDHTFLQLPKRFCAETIAAEVAALGPSAWTPHPGNFAGNDAVLLVTPHGQMTNGFFGPMAPTQHLLKCPYIMEIMAELGGVWGRSRLMGLAPGADVPPHVDVHYHWRTHLRIHIPVITSPKVVFTCGEDSVHMEAGECWVFDSFQMHNVRNGGTHKRVHLVLDTAGGEELWDLIEEAKQPKAGEPPLFAPGQRRGEKLAFELVDPARIMSPWELRNHMDFIAGHVLPGPGLDPILKRLDKFAAGWTAAWAQFASSPQGIPTYQRLIESVQRDLGAMGAGLLRLHNQVPLLRALSELIFQVALPQAPAQQPARIAGLGIRGVPGQRIAS